MFRKSLISVMLALLAALAFTVHADDILPAIPRIGDAAAADIRKVVSSTTEWHGVGLPVLSKKIPGKTLERVGYTTSYNKETLNPNWVAWRLTADHITGRHGRQGYSYVEDYDVSPRQCYSDWADASLMGFDHGHMCPAGDNKWSAEAMSQTFLLTNMCPQNSRLNQESWERLESACRKWAQRLGAIYIVCGPIYKSVSHNKMGSVAIPDAFFKVILYMGDNPRAVGFVYDNCAPPERDNMQNHVVPISEIEKATGITFFPQIKGDAAASLKSVTKFSQWNRF